MASETNLKEQIVFISYASGDNQVAEVVYYALKNAGLNPWLDKFSILPGQNWGNEIENAIKSSSYFIAILSEQSVSKRGYVQKGTSKNCPHPTHEPEPP